MYLKFSKCRKDLKRLNKQKMRDNLCSQDDYISISKKFWSYVKSFNNSNRIPTSVSYGNTHKTDITDQANLFNAFFKDQFSEPSSYTIDIDFDTPDSNCFEISFDVIEIASLLSDINPNKAQGPDNIPGRILKYCAASLAHPSVAFSVSPMNVEICPVTGSLLTLFQFTKKVPKIM